MATQHEDNAVFAAAEPLKGTPFELAFTSSPTPGTSRYHFQHKTAISASEARAIIAEALETLRSGKAEWTSGTPYGQAPGDEVPEQWASLYGPNATTR